MNYINMDSINFTANHIKNVNIAKRYYNNYKPCKVALVEMESTNPGDIKAIEKTANKWDISFTVFTHQDMLEAQKNEELLPKLKVYALTKQKNNFEKMNYSDILGVIEVVKKDDPGTKIEILQTKPSFINDKHNKKPAFTHIGKNLVNYVKKEYNKEPLYVNPTKVAVPFYEKLGFRPSDKRNTWCITPKS